MQEAHIYHGPKRSVDVVVRSTKQSVSIKIVGF